MNKNILWLWPLNFRNVRKILDVLIVKAEWKGLLVKQEIEFYIKKIYRMHQKFTCNFECKCFLLIILY